MNYAEFQEKIKKDKLDSVYLFWGQEEYLMNMTMDKLKERYIEDSFEAINYIRIDGKISGFQDLVDACETLPFMSDKKIILLNDIYEFMDNLLDREEERFYKYMDELGDFICLILMDNTLSISRNKKTYRYFNKRGRVVDFSKLIGKELKGWIEDILKKHDKMMNYSTINYFIQRSSYSSKDADRDLFDLENEILKIIDHSKNREISKDDIDKVLIRAIDTNIFKLLDAINIGSAEDALRNFNYMYMSKEPILKILYMINRQFRLILEYKLYRDKGYGGKKVQDKLQIKNYEFGKIKTQAGRFSIDRLEEIMKELLNIDIQLKTTTTDERLLIEMLLVKICNK